MNALSLRRTVLLGSTVVLIAAIAGYGVFEARRIIEGPLLTITIPRDGSATSSNSVVLAGSARNISFLTINDKPAYIDETGHFAEVLSPAPGYAIFTVSATDRFGRQASEQVHINVLNYCPASERIESLAFNSERVQTI